MIEAVNSVLSNAVLARGSAEQQSVARSFAANPERVQEVVQAPYVSPYISMDINYNKAVLQIRNSDNGEVVRQFPSESQLEAYRKAQAAQAAEETLAALASQGNGGQKTAQVKIAQPLPSDIASAARADSAPATVQPAPASAPSAPASTTASSVSIDA